MINPSDSTSVVKEQIEDAVSLAGYSAPTSWADATDKINGTADQFERAQIADGMNGGLARDRINALFGGPVWTPEGARLTIDFAANKAWTRNNAVSDSVDAVDLTRAGSVLMLGPDGYQSFPANTLARIDGIGGQVAPARVNKCTNWNANPVDLTRVTTSGDAAAVLSIVDDTAALVVAGLANICNSGKVYKLDNSAGATAAFAYVEGLTGNTNAHTVSLFVRGQGSSGFGLGGPGGDAAQAALTTNYVRRVHTSAAPLVSGRTYVSVLAGSIVYFILNQLEEGSYASPPIITSGAAVSRPGDILSASVPDGGRAFVFEFDLLEPVAIENSRYLVAWSAGGGDQNYLFKSNTGSLTLGTTLSSGGYQGGAVGAGSVSLGRNIVYGVASHGYQRIGKIGGTDGSAVTALPNAPRSQVSFGNNGANTSNNSFIHPKLFTERPVTDFATPEEAFAWAKSIAQGWS